MVKTRVLVDAPDHHDPPGIRQWQRLQEQSSQPREDRRVRADAEREGQDGRQSETRAAEQHPQRVPEVLQERVHLFTSFPAQRNQGIHPGGPPGRQESRQACHDEQEKRDAEEGPRVGRAHFEEKVA